MSEPMYPPDYNRTPDIEPKVPMIGAIQAPEELNIYTLFPAWVWQSPSIPQFYWNVYSAEQRIYQICKEIGRLQAYLTYQGQQDNAAHLYLYKHFQEITDKLREDLTAEIVRAKQAEKVLTDNLNAEIERAKQAEKVLTDNLNAEIERAKAAEKTISDGLAAEIARAKQAEKVLTDDLAAEKARAVKAETANQEAIKAETARAQIAENVNAEKIHQTNKDLVAEADRARAAETANHQDIETEKTTARAAEAANRKAIEDEAASARNAEAANRKAIEDEAASARAAETANAQGLTAETARATKAETANAQAIQALEPLAKAGEAYSHSHVLGSGHVQVADVRNAEGGHDYTVTTDYEPAVAKLEEDVNALNGRADQLKHDIDGVNVGVDQVIAGPGIKIQEAGDQKTGMHVTVSATHQGVNLVDITGSHGIIVNHTDDPVNGRTYDISKTEDTDKITDIKAGADISVNHTKTPNGYEYMVSAVDQRQMHNTENETSTLSMNDDIAVFSAEATIRNDEIFVAATPVQVFTNNETVYLKNAIEMSVVHSADAVNNHIVHIDFKVKGAKTHNYTRLRYRLITVEL